MHTFPPMLFYKVTFFTLHGSIFVQIKIQNIYFFIISKLYCVLYSLKYQDEDGIHIENISGLM